MRKCFRIWQHNPIFGVGIDNFQSQATILRDKKLMIQEGVFTVPDRSHNVILDHFANGGLFAGVLWIIFVILISKRAISLIKNSNEKNEILPSIVWFGYLFQSLISVDHLAITLLGFISAGLILKKSNELSSANDGLKGGKEFQLSTYKLINVILAISFLIITFLLVPFLNSEIGRAHV